VEPNSSLREAQHLAAVAAQRVWEELYVSKKPAVEEAFKISLGANTQHRAPSLELVREPALKLWMQYVEAERRSAYRTVLEVSTPNQIQSKIQKVTGGLTRLTSRSLTMKSSKKEDTVNAMGRHSHAGNLSYCWADVWLSTQYQLAGLKEQLELERRQRQQALQHVEQFNRLSWKRVEETELLRVRGLWGPSQESRVLTKWMLDMTEGPCRMRKKLTPNPHFYALYPYRPELELAENKSIRYKVATSLDAKEHFKLYSKWRQSLLQEDQVVDRVQEPEEAQQQSVLVESGSGGSTGDELVPSETILSTSQLPQDLPQLLRPIKRDVQQVNQTMADIDEEVELIGSSPAADEPLASSQSTAQQQPQDWQNLMRLLEENEKIGHLFRSARVQGLETVDGLLLFGNLTYFDLICWPGFHSLFELNLKQARSIYTWWMDSLRLRRGKFATFPISRRGRSSRSSRRTRRPATGAAGAAIATGRSSSRSTSARGWATRTSARSTSAATSSSPSPWRSSPMTDATTCWPSRPTSATKSTSGCWPRLRASRTRPANRWPVRSGRLTWSNRLASCRP
jgi:hypothetical protein